MTQTLDLPKSASEQQTDLQTKLTRMQRQLEAVYGAERIWAWLEEGSTLPAATITSAGTVTFEAVVDDVHTKRNKDGAKTRVVLVATRRGTPVEDLCELSDSATMVVSISPRVIQQNLFTSGQTVEADIEASVPPLEEAITDETLEVRLLGLCGDGKSLPEGWREWPQERKALVGQWAWAMILQASDNDDVILPEAPAGIAEWYWGENYVPTPPANGSANGDAEWGKDPPPPKLTPEATEAIAAKSKKGKKDGG